MVTIVFTIYATTLQDKIIFLIEQQLLMYYDFSHLCFCAVFIYI
jgi:hypothetical protein